MLTRVESTKPRASRLFFALSAFAAAVACLAPGAPAQTGARLLLEPFPKEEAVRAEGSAYFQNGGHLQEIDEGFRLSAYETRGRFRLKPGEIASPRVGYEFLYMDLNEDDDDGDGRVLPERLVDTSVSVATPIAKSGDWIFALTLGVGYAGDGAFGDGDAFYGLGTLAAVKQLSETSALVFVLDYDGNRTFLPDVPLPGVAYTRRIRDNIQLTLGLPVSALEWKPNDRLEVDVTYTLPDNLTVEVFYKVVNNLSLFGRFRNVSEAFYLDGLDENYDRLIFEQRRAEVGLRYEPSDRFNATLAAGYAFGGEFSTGFDQRETDLVADISDEPYLRAGLELKF